MRRRIGLILIFAKQVVCRVFTKNMRIGRAKNVERVTTSSRNIFSLRIPKAAAFHSQPSRFSAWRLFVLVATAL